MPKHTVYVEFEVEVDYDFEQASTGHRNEYGVPMEPDWPATVTVTSARIVGGPPISEDLLNLDAIEQEILEMENAEREPEEQEREREEVW